MKRVLITGANSYIGTNVEKWLIREPEKFHIDTLDMIDRSWMKKDFSGYDVVFHVAGIAHVDAKKKMSSQYYKVNKELTINTAKRAKASGVKQFIFMSSIIVYGESKSLRPFIITADTKPKPNGFYGDSKLQAEIGISALEDENFIITILRPPMIYGPGSKGNLPKLIKLAKLLPIVPDYHNQRSMLYIDNLCEFIRLLILNSTSGIQYPQNKEYFHATKFFSLVAMQKGRRIKKTKLLNPVLLLASRVVHSINKIWGTQIYSANMSRYQEGEYQLVSFEESVIKTLKYLS